MLKVSVASLQNNVLLITGVKDGGGFTVTVIVAKLVQVAILRNKLYVVVVLGFATTFNELVVFKLLPGLHV